MEIKISLPGESSDSETLTSFYEWLLEDRDIRSHADISLVQGDPDPSWMSVDFEMINLIVSSTFSAANLAVAYATWRSSRESTPPISFHSHHTTIVVNDASPETLDRIAEALAEPTNNQV